jgi:myo-inositol catabolism protein IolC
MNCSEWFGRRRRRVLELVCPEWTLGRGSHGQAVVRWLTVAAGVQGFIGFAVGWTTWLDAVTEWRAHTIGREIAAAQIARRFREWAAIFEHVSVRQRCQLSSSPSR